AQGRPARCQGMGRQAGQARPARTLSAAVRRTTRTSTPANDEGRRGALLHRHTAAAAAQPPSAALRAALSLAGASPLAATPRGSTAETYTPASTSVTRTRKLLPS